MGLVEGRVARASGQTGIKQERATEECVLTKRAAWAPARHTHRGDDVRVRSGTAG